MSTILILAIIAAIAVVVGVVVIAAMASSRGRTSRLRAGFGPEYDRAIRTGGSRRQAEKELEARQKRVEKLRLKEISPVRAQEHAERWRIVQGRFVDDPAGAIKQADQLCTIVMNERGYPMADFDQRAADISVDHPRVVSNYRSAHAISEAIDRHDATTESLRQAMVNFRSLFEDLLGAGTLREEARPPRESQMAR